MKTQEQGGAGGGRSALCPECKDPTQKRRGRAHRGAPVPWASGADPAPCPGLTVGTPDTTPLGDVGPKEGGQGGMDWGWEPFPW